MPEDISSLDTMDSLSLMKQSRQVKEEERFSITLKDVQTLVKFFYDNGWVARDDSYDDILRLFKDMEDWLRSRK